MAESLQYPIGKFVRTENPTPAIRDKWLYAIRTLPGRLGSVLDGMTDEQLDTPYRPGGWTVRQVVHHLADSHINAYCRTKLALTEERPAIRPYEQDPWAQLTDSRSLPVDHSLEILRGLHSRWTFLLNTLKETELQRLFVHPEYDTTFTIEEVMSLYAWHGDHHIAHIQNLKERKGWQAGH